MEKICIIAQPEYQMYIKNEFAKSIYFVDKYYSEYDALEGAYEQDLSQYSFVFIAIKLNRDLERILNKIRENYDVLCIKILKLYALETNEKIISSNGKIREEVVEHRHIREIFSAFRNTYTG